MVGLGRGRRGRPGLCCLFPPFGPGERQPMSRCAVAAASTASHHMSEEPCLVTWSLVSIGLSVLVSLPRRWSADSLLLALPSRHQRSAPCVC